MAGDGLLLAKCQFTFRVRLRVFSSLDELSLTFANLISTEHSESYFDSRSWYDILIRETLDPRDKVRLYGVEASDGLALCLLVACERTPRGAIAAYFRRRSLKAITNVYSVSFAIISAADLSGESPAIDFLVDEIAAERPRWSEIEFRFLDRSKETFCQLSAALRRNGFVTQEYYQYENYFQRFVGSSHHEYVSGLRSGIRRTLARRMRKLERSRYIHFELEVGGERLEQHISDYEQIYGRSWKESESQPSFVRSLLRQSAADRVLRLGLLYVEGIPAATQLALVCAGKATMYKTAYDEQFSKLGVGNIVIMKVMKHLIDVDGVSEIDFGIGEESYKRQWLSMRRERWGILALNPLTFSGSKAILCQLGGRMIREFFAKIPRAMTDRGGQ